MDGLALNIRIHPSALSRDDGVDKLRDMTKTYLNNGGMENSVQCCQLGNHAGSQVDPLILPRSGRPNCRLLGHILWN